MGLVFSKDAIFVVVFLFSEATKKPPTPPASIGGAHYELKNNRLTISLSEVAHREINTFDLVRDIASNHDVIQIVAGGPNSYGFASFLDANGRFWDMKPSGVLAEYLLGDDLVPTIAMLPTYGWTLAQPPTPGHDVL